MNKSKIIITLTLLIPICFFVSSLYFKKQEAAQEIHLTNGVLLPSPKALPDFNLVDTQGHAFTNSQLSGHWSLLFFGFTRCQMVCPTTLAELNQAYGILETQNLSSLPQVYFISVDPEHDSTTIIQHYLTKFNSHFIGLRGDSNELEKLSRSLGVAYAKIPGTENDYSMNHSNIILVINPRGEWTALLMPPHQAQTIADNFLQIQKQELK